MSEKKSKDGFRGYLERLVSGDEPLPNSPGNRHHYVPQTTLKRFRSSAKQGRKLFQLDKSTGTCEAVVPKKVGWEEGLYSLTDEAGLSAGFLEELFAKAESYAAGSIQRLLKQFGDFTDVDRWNVAAFVALQSKRSPASINQMDQLMRQMATAMAVVQMNDKKVQRRDRKLAHQAKQQLLAGELEVGLGRDGLLLMLATAFLQTSLLVESMSWVVLQSTAEHFICSDKPVTMIDPTPKQPWSGVGSESSPLVAATLPLSKNACIRFSHNRRTLVARATSTQVALINKRTYGWADRFVFGPSESQLNELHQAALATPDDFPAEPPMRNVMLEDVSTADPKIAKENADRGWAPYLYYPGEDGKPRKFSYEVIENMDGMRKSVSDRDPSESELGHELGDQ